MRFAGALVVVGLVVAQASPAHAFVPPTYQGGTLRGYTLLLGSYRLVEVAGTSMPAGSPFDVRIVLTATTLEIGIGTSHAEKATYRVTDHYGDIYRLEITGIKDKKVEGPRGDAPRRHPHSVRARHRRARQEQDALRAHPPLALRGRHLPAVHTRRVK